MVNVRIPRVGWRNTAAAVVLAAAMLLLTGGLAAADSVLVTSDSATTGPESSADSARPESSAPESSAAAAPAAPELSINVDNGKTSVTVGETLTYTITVNNLGTSSLDGLTITQTVPAGLHFDSADTDGVATAQGVSWTLDLASTTNATFHTTMTVTETQPDLLRLATVACATVARSTAPLVCASHSDELPAGAAATVAAAGTSQAQPPGSARWYIIGAIGLIVVLAAVGLVVYQTRRRRLG